MITDNTMIGEPLKARSAHQAPHAVQHFHLKYEEEQGVPRLLLHARISSPYLQDIERRSTEPLGIPLAMPPLGPDNKQ
jgi:hypothetical protein